LIGTGTVFHGNVDVFLRLLFKDDEEAWLEIDKNLNSFVRTGYCQTEKLRIRMAENS